jgi:hypothetical protein
MLTLVSLGAVCVAALGTGAGVGTKIYDGVHVWLTGGQPAVTVRSAVIIHYPLGPELRDAVAHATFPVVFPVGVPAGSRVNMITLAPAGHPSAITLYYRGKGGFNASFALLDPAIVSTDGTKPPTGSVGIGHDDFTQWRLGGEVVLVRARSVPPDALERIKTAMIAASPQESVGAIEAMLPTMIVLGGSVRLDLAERYRPASRPSVLLDHTYAMSIPALAKRNEPMVDSRKATVDDVRYAKGELASAHLVKGRKELAISRGGVRSIDAVLRFSSRDGRRDCACQILFHQPSRTAYWVWTMSLSGPATASKYAVDAKTFAVSRVP